MWIRDNFWVEVGDVGNLELMELGRWVIFADIPLPDDTRCIFVLVRTQRFLTSDVGSMLKGRRPSWMLYRRQKISWPQLVENCRTGCLEPGRVATDVDSQDARRSWPFMTYYITYIYINHIMTAASIQFYSRFVETFRNGDRDRFLRSKATWRRCHLGILPASSELWRRSKKARLGNWTPTLKADLVPQKCWSHLLSIKLDGFVSKIVFNSCFCLVTFLNCFLWESWPRCFFVSIFFEHRIQDDIPPSFSYCIDVILFITLSDYRYIHHNSIR